MTAPADIHFAPWFSQLEPAAQQKATVGLSRRSYSAGTYIAHRGDRLPYWTGVAQGIVKLSATAADGRAMSFAGVGAGGWFGEGSILKDEPRKYDIVALRDSVLERLDVATFKWLSDNSLAFNKMLVRTMNERMGQFIATIELDRIFDPTARVARHIAWLVNPVLNPLIGNSVEVSQEELALLAGVSRATTNKALQSLAAEGLISLTRGGFNVIEVERLTNYANPA